MYTLTTQPYYDCNIQNYTNIIRINIMPEGPLRFFVRRVKLHALSSFRRNNIDRDRENNSCILALVNFTDLRWMSPNDIPDLFSFLYENNYIINSEITKMMNYSDVRLTNQNIICFFSYNKK